MTRLAEYQRLEVALGQRSYPIHIGSGLLDDAGLLKSQLAGRQLLVVSDAQVAPLYLQRVVDGLAAPARIHSHVIGVGETQKTPQTWLALIDRLVHIGALRDSAILALGGGVVGDLCGFAAACYMRGIDFIQCPTTLLAQVDSSVGGKTGVNHPAGKNLIGAFHQPRAVVIDVATLDSLPDREYAAGMAETIKTAAIVDAQMFDWMEAHARALADREPDVLAEAIARACRRKADIVAADEREQGNRALLNFGHSFGHAIEALSGFGTLLHGEAVAIGMCLAARLSRQLGRCDAAAVQRLHKLLRHFELPVQLPAALDAERLLELMRLDKKNRNHRLRLILMAAIGECRIADDVPEAAVRAVLEDREKAC